MVVTTDVAVTDAAAAAPGGSMACVGAAARTRRSGYEYAARDHGCVAAVSVLGLILFLNDVNRDVLPHSFILLPTAYLAMLR